MQVSVGELIVAADRVIVGFGHAPSTLWQYRWAWSQFEVFCAREGVGEVTEDVVLGISPLAGRVIMKLDGTAVPTRSVGLR
jgi:hypothetical protein